MNKLTDTAKKLDQFFKIFHSVLTALAIAAGVCTGLILVAWLLKLDPDTIGTGYENLDIGFWELQIADGYAPDKWLVLLQGAVSLALGCVICLIARNGVGCIRGILLPVAQGKPFTQAVCENLKRLAAVSLILGILVNLLGVVELIFATFVYDIPDLLIGEKITHVTANYTIDISFLLISAVLLLLSYIFRYGTQLQQLSDETL